MENRAVRLAPLAPDDWSEEARHALAGLTRPDGSVLNIFATLARHPKLLESWLGFGVHVLGSSTLEPRERELAILRVGWLCRSEYEWGQHVAIGKHAGVTDVDLARLGDGPDAAGWSDRERAILHAVDALHETQTIGDAEWRALAQHLDERQLLDLVFTVGQYTLVSMALNTLGIPLDDGVSGFPS
ncbi:MAG: carboxymuconolactone decarboxylase family protein [Myxococcota bacterium]|nr:carboxymuconolactone decarboxylase family protein [Myxococcota bacterium]